MKKQSILFFIFGLVSASLLSSCSSDLQKAPCPHYGRFCTKTPINSWTAEYENNGDNNA